jgi:hypothetical protein
MRGRGRDVLGRIKYSIVLHYTGTSDLVMFQVAMYFY